MIKLLLLALLFFIGYSFFNSLFPTRKQRPKPGQEGEQMVQDPECGTYLPLSEALKAKVNGQPVYFCSRKCRSQYKKRA